ncbi:MAG: hypothetical protein JXB32_22660 [Deltaproteobacteria bacterium]|nr:hypothetical protein [Deltaproteobacteria bacterium]
MPRLLCRLLARPSGRLVAAVALAGLLAACGRRRPAEADETPGADVDARTAAVEARWVSDVELAVWRFEAEAEAEANRTRRCPRPPLRGEPLPGPADDDLAAFVEPPDDLAECVDTVEALRGELRNLHHPVAQPPDGLPRRVPGWWRAPDDPDLPLDALRQVVAACPALPARLHRAVAHEDSCSPYAPGRRRIPSLLPPVRLAQALEVLAREALAAGRPEEAADLALDALRLGQDLRRGPVPWLVAIVSLVFTETAAGILEEALVRPEPLPDGLAARAARELEALAASEPDPSPWVDGEMLGTVLQELLPVLAGPDWEPPGGKDVGRERAAPLLVARGLAPRDQAALAWAGLRRIRDAFRESCPPGTPARPCVDGWLEAGRRLGVAARDPAAVAELEAELRDAGGDERAVAVLRERVVAVIAGVAAPLLARQSPRPLAAPLWLAGLRLLAAFRRFADETAACPAFEAFAGPPLLEARLDPTTGGPLAVAAGPEPGVYVVRAELPLPRLTESRAPADPGPVVVLRCPPAPDP